MGAERRRWTYLPLVVAVKVLSINCAKTRMSTDTPTKLSDFQDLAVGIVSAVPVNAEPVNAEPVERPLSLDSAVTLR